MNPSQLAINTVSLKFTEMEEALSACAEAGFRNVEFCLPQVYQYFAKGGNVGELKKMLAKHSLRCIGGFEGVLTCFASPTDTQANRARIMENGKLLSELGGPGTALVVGTDGPADLAKCGDPWPAMGAAFAEVAAQVRPMGVTLCIEFNWSPIVKTLDSAARIVKHAKSQNVGVLFDPAHYYCTPTKLEMISGANAQAIKHVHVNDMRDKPPEVSNCNADRLLPGEGILDLGTIFRRIESAGYKGYFSIEMFSDKLWAMPARDAAKAMYQSLLPLCG